MRRPKIKPVVHAPCSLNRVALIIIPGRPSVAPSTSAARLLRNCGDTTITDRMRSRSTKRSTSARHLREMATSQIETISYGPSPAIFPISSAMPTATSLASDVSRFFWIGTSTLAGKRDAAAGSRAQHQVIGIKGLDEDGVAGHGVPVAHGLSATARTHNARDSYRELIARRPSDAVI
jgi:hypothetical protein